MTKTLKYTEKDQLYKLESNFLKIQNGQLQKVQKLLMPLPDWHHAFSCSGYLTLQINYMPYFLQTLNTGAKILTYGPALLVDKIRGTFPIFLYISC